MSTKGEATATILDVARRAGVSRTTVSRVLNEPDRVSPDTLERVRAAVAELKYAPNTVARGLRSGRTGLVALLVGDISQPFHGALAQAVAAAAEERGLGVILYDLGHSRSRLQDVLNKLPGQGVDGIIIATADDISAPEIRAALAHCLESHIAVVTGMELFDDDAVAAVNFDPAAGSRLAVEALAAAGKHAPALLVGDAASPLARHLARGAPTAHLLEAGYSFEGAGRVARELPREVDSVIAATLPMAIGVWNALADEGRELPLILCEDTPLAAHVRPSFTTVAIAPETLGAEMVRLVTRRAREEPAPALQPQLVRRETF